MEQINIKAQELLKCVNDIFIEYDYLFNENLKTAINEIILDYYD